MADIELVIKIPEEIYSRILERNRIHTFDNEIVCDAIKNGTPLPEGHGRLIDADELKTMCYEVFIDTDNPNTADGLSSFDGLVKEDIDLAPTIIEADKAESEET